MKNCGQKRYFFLFLLMIGCCRISTAQFSVENKRPVFRLNDRIVLTSPDEGLWSVATDWNNDWMDRWVHIRPVEEYRSGDWTVLQGKQSFPEGDMFVRDSYRMLSDGCVQGIRRYEWRGTDTLRKVTLSVRLQMKGDALQLFAPGLVYYGNSNGAKIDSTIIPVYRGQPGEWAIFEDHRYPHPFVMLENGPSRYAAAVYTTPSPVRGAVLADQWWSLGVEAFRGYSEFVLYSGPIGYNRQHSVAKALQQSPMRYADAYVDFEPGRVVEKEFFVELYPIERQGSGFQQAVRRSIERYKPFDAERFASFDEIVHAKYKFALRRWIDENGKVGFGMYDLSVKPDIVMGWCGQADSPGYALQVLEKRLEDRSVPDRVQRSLDFLSGYPVDEVGNFPVGYRIDQGKYHGGDPVSCGQAMYNFAKAIEVGRRSKRYDTRRWERFLQQACDGVSKQILMPDWKPRSSAEGFYVAPLAIASRLFKNRNYKNAAVKVAEILAGRHLENASYWGGTLDATCEDKEGAWAAFQGFLELYERFGEKRFLTWAEHAMDVCLSYVVVWDIPLPAGRMADYNFKTTGWTVVSPQNQHIDVYGVLFAPEVYKMGVHLKNEQLKRLSKVMYRSCFQLTDPFGSQGEQLQQTNFAQRGDMTDVHRLRGGYSENWTVFWITAHFLNAAARFEEMGVEP